MIEPTIERRFLTVAQRAAGSNENPTIEGEAVVFNQEAVIGSWFREMIAPGAFRRVLSEKPDVIGAYNHDWNDVLGRTTAETLFLEETKTALRYVIDVNPEDTDAMNIYRKVKRGDVSQASFAFTVRTEEWIRSANDKELPLRIIKEIDQLYDVGPCTFGAYPEASANARSKASEFQEPVPDLMQEPKSGETPTDLQEQTEVERRRLDLLKLKYLS
jgi:HK97 family phage prohead protease